RLLAAFRADQAKLDRQAPATDWIGMWCSIEDVDKGLLVARDEQIEEMPRLRDALAEFDKKARLTFTAIEKWQAAAKAQLEATQLDHALKYAESAFRCSRFPYVVVKTKDDTLLKLKAAHATFESGSEKEAIQMILQLIDQRVK